MFPPQKDRTRDPSLLPFFRGSLFSLLVKGGGKHFGLACLRRGKNGCWKPNAKIRHPRSPPTPLPSFGPGFGTPKGFRVFREPLQAPFSGAGVGIITEGEGSLEPRGKGGVRALWGVSRASPSPGLVAWGCCGVVRGLHREDAGSWAGLSKPLALHRVDFGLGETRWGCSAQPLGWGTGAEGP